MSSWRRSCPRAQAPALLIRPHHECECFDSLKLLMRLAYVILPAFAQLSPACYYITAQPCAQRAEVSELCRACSVVP